MEEFSKLLEGPRGKLFSAGIISFTAVVLSIGIALLNYIAGNSSIISYLLCSIPCIISFFYLGASLHLSVIESKEEKLIGAELGELISKRMAYISSLVNEGNGILREFQVRSKSEVVFHSESTHINLSMLRRFINALEERQNSLIELSGTISIGNLKMAEELSFAPLVFVNSSIHSVNQREIPALSQEQWESSLNSMIEILEIDNKKVAA